MSGTWKEHEVMDLTVESSSVVTTSDVADIGNYSKIALLAPSGLKTGSISFDVSHGSGNDFFRLKGSDATELKVAASTGSAVFSDLPGLAPIRFVKLVTATQSTAQTFRLICKS